jgi:hypothetical protein
VRCCSLIRDLVIRLVRRASEQHEAAAAHSQLEGWSANRSKANAKGNNARASQTPTHHLSSKEDHLCQGGPRLKKSTNSMHAPIMTPKRKAQQASPMYSWARGLSESVSGHRSCMTTRTFSRMKRENIPNLIKRDFFFLNQ